MGHAQINKGKMKGNDHEIDTAQTPKRFDRRLALEEKIRKTFTGCIPNKTLLLPERSKDSLGMKFNTDKDRKPQRYHMTVTRGVRTQMF